MTRTLLALAIALGSSPAFAQDYPSKPITMIVGFAAGGFADTLARTVGSKLSERLGQNVIIKKCGGAGGNIAAAVVAKTPPDGSTTGISFYELLNKNSTFALDELKVVAISAWAPETLSVAPNHSAKTLAELIQAGRAKSISFATPGAGTASHIAAAYFFKELAKINVVHVPFQGGAPAVNASQHTGFMWEKLPYRLAGNSAWSGIGEEYGRAMLALWCKHAPQPNFADAVLGSFTRTPMNTERSLPNMREDDLLVGAFTNGQIGYHRPFPGAGSYRTYLPSLYLHLAALS